MLKHHAYLYRLPAVNLEVIKPIATSFAVEEVIYLELENFGISDVRNLIQKAYTRPQIGEQQLLVICLNTITVEAQQALLKILEEPPTSAIFIFCVPNSLYLLPTLLSRFLENKDHCLQKTNDQNFLSEFLLLSKPDRLSEITKKTAAKDTEWISRIKTDLLQRLVKNTQGFTPETLALLFWIGEHLQTRGASNKQLLEEMALTL